MYLVYPVAGYHVETCAYHTEGIRSFCKASPRGGVGLFAPAEMRPDEIPPIPLVDTLGFLLRRRPIRGGDVEGWRTSVRSMQKGSSP